MRASERWQKSRILRQQKRVFRGSLCLPGSQPHPPHLPVKANTSDISASLMTGAAMALSDSPKQAPLGLSA